MIQTLFVQDYSYSVMKKSTLFLTIISALCLLPLLSSAQYILDYKRQGDVYFAREDYFAAAVYYQKALNLLPDTTGKTYFYPYAFNGTFGKRQEKNSEKYQYLVYQLGEAFRKYKDYKSAEKWYDKALKFKNDKFPLARLWYAVCLRADKNYREAINQLEQFREQYTKQDEYNRQAALELKSCRFALDQMKYPRLTHIQKLPVPINDSGSNYAPAISGNNFYFTSSRPLKNIDRRKNNPFVNKIYSSELSGNNRFDAVSMIPLKIDKQTEVAAPAFSPAHTHLYFTEWRQPKKKNETAGYVIAMSTKEEAGDWSTPIPLDKTVNAEGYNTKEPFMTADGQYLIFSSDRPGGQGGYDLWYCSLNAEGMPEGDAVNLGAAINTKADETNPYYSTNTHILVFSSNGRIGMGGFDLYKTKGTIGNKDWSSPQNLGYPINSSKDDNFYYPIGSDSTQFYTSSDRHSVCCLELYNVQLKHTSIEGTVFDCDTQEPLSGTTVILTDSIGHHAIDKVVTDHTGQYHFKVIYHKPLKLKFSKSKYFTKNVEVSTGELNRADTLFSKSLCLKAFEIGKPIVIPNILYDFDKATLRPESKVVLDSLAKILKDNPNLIVQMSAHTDSVGTDEYNMKLSQRRAQSCVDYLAGKGIPSYRMKARGYGETRPIAPNSNPDGSDNPAGRQKNRRTEFTVLKD